MTRNLYLGGDILRPVGARTREEFEQKTTELWQIVQGTDFPSRAKPLAREVKLTQPDLIGLQEVALWRRGPDGLKDGSATPASTVVYDYLKTLQKELSALGLRYRVGSQQQEADIEASTSLGYDVRLTMRDVILVKSSRRLRAGSPRSANYTTEITVPTQGGPFTAKRGWTSVDVRIAGRRLRFVNTHLEAFGNDARVAQAKELLGSRGPLRARFPIVVVGDLNSDRKGPPGPEPDAYNLFTRAGFRDTWLQTHPRDPRISCCLKQENLLDPPPAPFDHRIDHVLTKPRVRTVRSVVVGNDPGNRTPAGLWPSDHGGVVTTLRLR